ncbi:MAG: cation:proton antiporter [Ilumatobacteraceae bacterium]
MLAAGAGESAIALVEIGAVILALAVLGRLAGRLGITAVPLYLLAGISLGESGLIGLRVGEEFVTIAAEIGVLLLLLVLGLEYTDAELREGLRTGLRPGGADMAANALPGVAAGFLLGWEPIAAVLLGGVTWVSSSGIISKVLSDLGRVGNRETPTILNTLVIEDLAMAVYLPVVAALVVGGTVTGTVTTVTVAVCATATALVLALRYGGRFSQLLAGSTDETLILSVFGITLLVAGLAERIEVSGAIGAFLVGLAISGKVEVRASELMQPLRDLFAATFFVFFAFQIDPADVWRMLIPALALATITSATKMASGWYAAGLAGAAPRGRFRAGTMLIARGEFSIVIAALGSSVVNGPDLTALAAAYVLLTAIAGPVLTRFADRVPLPARLAAPAKQSLATE